MNLTKITGFAVRGFSVGLASHGISTALAYAVNPTAGLFAGTALALNAVVTSLVVPYPYYTEHHALYREQHRADLAGEASSTAAEQEPPGWSGRLRNVARSRRYEELGITHFVLSDTPHLAEIKRQGSQLLPLMA
jgi:hypothetical protein